MRLRVAVALHWIMPGDFEACFERETVSIEGKLMLQSVRNLAHSSNLLLGRPPPEPRFYSLTFTRGPKAYMACLERIIRELHGPPCGTLQNILGPPKSHHKKLHGQSAVH
jgi:hypothetical protein